MSMLLDDQETQVEEIEKGSRKSTKRRLAGLDVRRPVVLFQHVQLTHLPILIIIIIEAVAARPRSRRRGDRELLHVASFLLVLIPILRLLLLPLRLDPVGEPMSKRR